LTYSVTPKTPIIRQNTFPQIEAIDKPKMLITIFKKRKNFSKKVSTQGCFPQFQAKNQCFSSEVTTYIYGKKAPAVRIRGEKSEI